jgi:hypothetical protein
LALLGAAAIELCTGSAAPAKARADEAVHLAASIENPALMGEAAHMAGLFFLMAGRFFLMAGYRRRALALLDSAISSAYEAGRPVAAASARQALWHGTVGSGRSRRRYPAER